jgi:CHASE2 domain-containing sensor protein
VATLKLDMAPASALREATVDYEGLLRASPEALSGLVHGRVLLIGDARTTTPSPDLLDGIEGRDRVPGVEIVASSLEAVLQRHAKWAPDQAGSTLWLSAVAAVGAGVALLWRRVIARRSAGRAGVVWALGAAALLMMAVGGALVAYVGFDLITSPVVLSFCAVLAFVFASIVLLARRPWSIFTSPFEAGGFQGWGLQKEACDATIA